MKSIKFILILLIGSISFFSCQEEEYLVYTAPAQFTDVLHLLTEVEYAFYIENRDDAKSLLKKLDNVMQSCDDMICASDHGDLIKITSDLQYLETNLASSDFDHLLDKLRTVKGNVISLQTDDDYDPYTYMMWQYEEDMYYVTKAATDPMLDLYEWGEFVGMIECMNDSWERIMYHNPASAQLDRDQGLHRNQMVKKIGLDRSMKEFNYVVYTDDAPEYTICEAGEMLRIAYVNYLQALLFKEDPTSVFLAIL